MVVLIHPSAPPTLELVTLDLQQRVSAGETETVLFSVLKKDGTVESAWSNATIETIAYMLAKLTHDVHKIMFDED